MAWGRLHAVTTARLATRADVPALGRALADAFSTDPLWRWIVPDDRAWERHAAAAFAHEVEAKLGQGHTYTTDDRAGAAVWALPERWRDGPLAVLRSAWPMGRLVGRRGTAKGLAVLREIERRHPPGAHWYLAILATSPAHQGKGVGPEVLSPVLERCDLDGVGAYLESSNSENRGFYERQGFVVRATITPGGSPPIDLMWREPRTPGGERP